MSHSNSLQPVLLEIDARILKNLLQSQGLSITDFRCSDQESKKRIREIYLQITQNDLQMYSIP